jgi:uncharacterized radical SAM protein YgiQ
MEMIAFSVNTHRGCAGGCTFCSLAVHQGRRIASRSAAAVKRDVARLTRHPDWKGALSDVGGPSANMWGAECRRKDGECRRVSCLWPAVCGHLAVDQSALTALLADLARLPGVRHVRTASGVRYDLALRDAGYVAQLVRGFVGGQLKLAPEHTEDPVLTLMRKPPLAVFERFMAVFAEHSRGAGKEQYIVPYLISAFPGCRDEDMRRMAGWLNGKGWRPQQVQCFIPLPGTVAAAMFAAGIDTRGHPIHVARSDGDRRRQHAILMRLA